MRTTLLLLSISIAATAQASITGSIVGDDGKPVAGATVRAFAVHDSRTVRANVMAGKLDRDPVSTTQSADSGAFTADAKGNVAIDLMIESSGRQPVLIPSADGDDVGTIVLQTAPRNALVTSGGKPVANAAFFVGENLVARSNAAGEATLPATSGGNFVVVHPDYAISQQLKVSGNRFEFTLTKGIVLRGRVLNANGPVAHAVVSIGGWPLAESADDGGFSIAHAPENWRTMTAVKGKEVGVAMRKSAASIELRIGSASTLTGTVRDATNGAAVAGARILLVPALDRDSAVTVPSDAKGNFAVDALPPGKYSIDGRHPAYAIDSSTFDVPQATSRAVAAQPFARARGRVIDESRQPVVGAMVQSSVSFGPVRRTTTNAAGEFSLRLTPRNEPSPLIALKRDYATGASASITWRAGETHKDVVITLPHGFPLQVNVVDVNRQPVANANVFMVRNEDSGPSRFFVACADPSREDCRRTGANGIFNARIIEGRYDINVTGEGLAPKRIGAQALTARSSPLVIEVTRGAEVTGRVVYADGSPVAGVTVNTQPSSGAGDQTAPDGTFKLGSLPPGKATLVATSADRRMTSPPVDVTAPASNVTITMPRGGHLDGRVIDRATSQPITEFSIALSVRESPMSTSAPTQFHADDGTFSIENVPAGTRGLRVTATGYVPGSRTDLSIDEGKSVTGVEVQLEHGARVSGRVTGGGVPQSGVRVRAESNGPSPGDPTTTDGDGNYTLDGVIAGDRVLSFQKEGFLVKRKAVEASSGKDARLDVDLERGRELRGRVTDRGGHPVAGASLMTTPNAGFNRMANVQTEGDGSFVIDSLADGHYTVTARKNGLINATADADVPQSTPLTLTMESGATITGRVTGLSEQDLANVTVSAYSAQSSAQTRVEPGGAFTLTGIADGRIMVNAYIAQPGRMRRSVMKNVTVENGTAPSVEIDFNEGLSVRGHVMQNGTPVRASLTFLPTPRTAERPPANAQSGQDGIYEIGGLTAGDYEVMVYGPQFRYRTTYTASANNATLDIDVRGATLRGRVIDASTSAPIANASLSMQSIDPPGTSMGAAADSDGRFVIDGLPDMKYRLHVEREAYAPKIQEMVISGGTAPEIEVRMEPAPAVTFRMVDSITGAPVDAGVSVVDGNGTMLTFSLTRIDEGVTRMWLQPGNYTAHAFKQGYVNQKTSFSVPGPDVRILLEQAGRLLLHARTAQTIRLVSPGAARPSLTRSIPEGTTGPIEQLAPGPYTLQVIAKDGNVLRSIPVTIIAGQTSQVDLE